MIRIGPSEVASSSSRAVFPSEIEIPDGFRETLTDAWPGDGPLRCFTLLNLENFSPFPLPFLCSCSTPDTQTPHSFLRSYCSLRSGANAGWVYKTWPADQVHHHSAHVFSCIMVKEVLALGEFVFSAKSGFHFFSSSCSFSNKPRVWCLHPLSPTCYPHYYFMYYLPRSLPIVDHSSLPFEPNYPNLPVLCPVVSGPVLFVDDTRLSI